MEPKLKVEKTQAEWIRCEYGLQHRVSVCIRVENGDTKLDGKIVGLKGNGETTYVKYGVLESLALALSPFLKEVEKAKERTGDEASEVLLPQEQFAKVRLAERERCARIAEAYKAECATYADAIAQVIREG